MRRLVMILIAITAICVALVHVRRREARVRHEIHRGLTRQTALRRRLWNQRVRIAHLVAPREVRRRTREMALGLIGRDDDPMPLAATRSER